MAIKYRTKESGGGGDLTTNDSKPEDFFMLLEKQRQAQLHDIKHTQAVYKKIRRKHFNRNSNQRIRS